ncbi:MAG: hypothetical protein R3301_03890 [Saprospiraceae bacterium]|nr:hypothetical protein [Saprospiraceae bacterium]
MKRQTLLLLAITPLLGQAQIYDSDTLVTIAYWQEGETYHYKLDKYRYKEKNDEVTEASTTSFVRFFIAAETDSNYLIEYAIDSIMFDGPYEDNPVLRTFASEISTRLVYQFETDPYGSFLQVVNWREVRERIIGLWSDLEVVRSAAPDERRQMDQAIRLMTDSQEKIEAMLSREFAVLFENYGYAFDTRDTTEYEQTLPNPYGETPFPKAGKIYFDTDSVVTRNSVTLYDISAIDPGAGKQAIIQALKQISSDSGSLDAEMEHVRFSVEDRMTQEFSITNGALLRAEMQREIIANDLNERNLRIDRQTWELVRITME